MIGLHRVDFMTDLGPSFLCCPIGYDYIDNYQCSQTPANPCPQGYSFVNGQCRELRDCAFKFSVDVVGAAGNLDRLVASTSGTTPTCIRNLIDAERNHCNNVIALNDMDSFDDCVALNFMMHALGVSEIALSGSTAIYFDEHCNAIPANEANLESCKDAGRYEFLGSPISLIWETLTTIEDLSQEVKLVNFPIDPTQSNKLVEWKASKEAPLLVYDPSGEGKITSGYQLFGNWTFGPKKLASLNNSEAAGKLWKNGFEALATLDLNADGEVSGTELKDLSLWFDENRNGISEKGEVRRLSSEGVKKLFYKNIENNDLAHAVFVKAGFEREVEGKTLTGIAVDWFADSASSEIEYAQKEMMYSTLNKLHTPVEDTKMDIPESELAAYKAGAKLVEGIWAWESSDKKNPVKNGRFILNNKEDGTFTGITTIELPIVSKFGATSLASIQKITGKAKLSKDGSVKISFKLDNKEVNLSSKANLTKDNESMNGTSYGRINTSAAKTKVKYTWTAKKLK
jgi:hypothetical protein